jgi:hypothetical protein
LDGPIQFGLGLCVPSIELAYGLLVGGEFLLYFELVSVVEAYLQLAAFLPPRIYLNGLAPGEGLQFEALLLFGL